MCIDKVQSPACDIVDLFQGKSNTVQMSWRPQRIVSPQTSQVECMVIPELDYDNLGRSALDGEIAEFLAVATMAQRVMENGDEPVIIDGFRR